MSQKVNYFSLEIIAFTSAFTCYDCRTLAVAAGQTKSQPKVEAEKSQDAKLQQNMSFMANIFRGELEASQVFPYPNVLNEVSHINGFPIMTTLLLFVN